MFRVLSFANRKKNLYYAFSLSLFSRQNECCLVFVCDRACVLLNHFEVVSGTGIAGGNGYWTS